MRTAIVATLLALGTIATLAPVAAADAEAEELRPICYWLGTRDSSTTVGVGPLEFTFTTRYAHLASGCIGP